jgi:hypothetical protein
MKRLGNGWLSPQGDWYPCNTIHSTIVIALLFSRNNQELFKNQNSIDFEIYLEKIGWIKHHDRPFFQISIEGLHKLKSTKFTSLRVKSLKIKIYCDRAYDYARSFF